MVTVGYDELNDQWNRIHLKEVNDRDIAGTPSINAMAGDVSTGMNNGPTK